MSIHAIDRRLLATELSKIGVKLASWSERDYYSTEFYLENFDNKVLLSAYNRRAIRRRSTNGRHVK